MICGRVTVAVPASMVASWAGHHVEIHMNDAHDAHDEQDDDDEDEDDQDDSISNASANKPGNGHPHVKPTH
jgi:hypothetical protein